MTRRKPRAPRAPRPPEKPALATGRVAAATGAAIAAVVALACLAHLAFALSAGALWRDEANTVAFARLPSLAELWRNFHFDSVPLAATLMVRAWTALGLGSDPALRVLGLLVGCGIVAALVISARAARVTLPACSLVLVALSAWVIRGGDAIRPTGLGILFTVLAFGALAAALERPTVRRGALATLAAVMSVQSLYANLPLVLALSAAAFAVAWITRSRPRALIAAALLATPALSLLPYRGAIASAREWSELVQIGGGTAQLLGAFEEAAAPDATLWVLVLIAAVALGLRRWFRPRPAAGAGAPDTDFDRGFTLFALKALIGSALLLFLFFRWSRLEVQPWYFLPWMALAGLCADVLLAPMLSSIRYRLPLLALIVAVAALQLALGRGALMERQTNVDLIAARVSADAGPNDLVLVSPWYLGIPFRRYYSGRAPWQTVPPLEDTRIHRMDLMKRAMENPALIEPALAAVDSALARGATIWMVGGLPRVAPGSAPRRAPPAPAPGFGWSLRSYTAIWSSIVLDEVRAHATRFEPVPVVEGGVVQPREREALFRASGWR